MSLSSSLLCLCDGRRFSQICWSMDRRTTSTLISALVPKNDEDNLDNDTLSSQVRTLMTEQEQKRGSSYFEGEPIADQSVTMLCYTLNKCIQGLQAEIDEQQRKRSHVRYVIPLPVLGSNVPDHRCHAEKHKRFVD